MASLNDKNYEPIQHNRKLSWMLLKKMGFHVWRQFDDPYYAGFAAQIAYFFFMSSIPILIVTTQLLGLFDLSVDFVEDWLEAHLSSQLSEFLQGLFSASSATFSSIFMVILALWASSSLTFVLSRLATHTISNGKYRFNWFSERGKAVILGMLSIAVIVAALLVYAYGEMVANSIFQSELATRLIGELKTPVLALLFFGIILANYSLLPRIRIPVIAVMPGAIVATIGITLVTWIYSLYIEKAANYNILYGAFSNIVALMLWFYLISWVVCIGMMFNKSWDIHMKRGRLTPEKIKEYLYAQYGENGAEMYRKLIIGDFDMFDPSLDTLAVKFSRKFDPGYNEKREREIRELRTEEQIRDKVVLEMRGDIEKNMREDAENYTMEKYDDSIEGGSRW
ncbi:MAG: YihY/virulence factor BrkB family protein [Clostridiales bacterium]|nr:YihY/virulence factor BrkB family protein [Candidatus Crickella caballi]